MGILCRLVFFWLMLPAMFGCLATYAQEKPNIVFILTDDLGYSDLGWGRIAGTWPHAH